MPIKEFGGYQERDRWKEVRSRVVPSPRKGAWAVNEDTAICAFCKEPVAPGEGFAFHIFRNHPREVLHGKCVMNFYTEGA